MYICESDDSWITTSLQKICVDTSHCLSSPTNNKNATVSTGNLMTTSCQLSRFFSIFRTSASSNRFNVCSAIFCNCTYHISHFCGISVGWRGLRVTHTNYFRCISGNLFIRWNLWFRTKGTSDCAPFPCQIRLFFGKYDPRIHEPWSMKHEVRVSVVSFGIFPHPKIFFTWNETMTLTKINIEAAAIHIAGQFLHRTDHDEQST